MNIFQAIETRYVGPTNTQGSRIIAITGSGIRRVYHWDYELNQIENHHAAAEKLRAELDWPAVVAGGSTVKGFAFCTSVL